MNDLVFVFFSISIAIFLLGMVVMLPNILFSTDYSDKDKKNTTLKDEKKSKERIKNVESTYRKKHEKMGV
ncbi:hypothetical protein D9O36_10855 [Zobellia amurskyensis]|uniref:Uncharacterized protein n=2 Tax=Zobellia amurskyensis TaxID=248905 RepID=A0A7X2ZTX7_9FLAO|nr:hypothetical protein [Zobellia amurskyensis]